MLRIRFICVSFLCLLSVECKDSVHLVLRNVNFPQHRKQVNDNYDVLDLSLYLPKTMKSSLANFGYGNRHATSKRLPVRKLKINQEHIFKEGHHTDTAPYFESYSRTVPQKLKSSYNPPFYDTEERQPAVQSAHQIYNKKLAIKLPNYGYTFKKPRPVHVSMQTNFKSNSPRQFTTFSNDPNEEAANTEILYGKSVHQASPHYEAYIAPMPINKGTIANPLTTPSYLNDNSNLRTRPINTNIRHQNPLTNTQYTTGYQISPLDLHAPVQSENDELIHQSPVKTLLLNNTIYHDDSYTSLNEESDDSSKEKDESYQVSEHPQESRKKYQQKPPKRQALSFVINVEDTSKEPSTKQQTFVEPSPSQPLPLPFISPLRSNIGRGEYLPDTRKQVKTRSNNGSMKRITDEIKHFQDIFVSQNSPHELEFGHVLDSPELSEERFEQKDFKEQRHRGKVRWTDKNGGYGEHYWDLEHSKKMS